MLKGLQGGLNAANLGPTNYTDISGAPGNGTVNSPRGRCAIAAAAQTVVITSSIATLTSTILAILETSDATLTSINRVTPANGSFTFIGNAAATGNVTVSFVVIN